MSHSKRHTSTLTTSIEYSGGWNSPLREGIPRLTSSTSASDCHLAQVSHATGPLTQANNPGRRSGTADAPSSVACQPIRAPLRAIRTDTATASRLRRPPRTSTFHSNDFQMPLPVVSPPCLILLPLSRFRPERLLCLPASRVAAPACPGPLGARSCQGTCHDRVLPRGLRLFSGRQQRGRSSRQGFVGSPRAEVNEQRNLLIGRN